MTSSPQRDVDIRGVALDTDGQLYLSRSADLGGYNRPDLPLVERWTRAGHREVVAVHTLDREKHPSAPAVYGIFEALSVDDRGIVVATSGRSVATIERGEAATLVTGGVGFGDWERHAGGDPDAEPPSYTAVLGDGRGGAYIADPQHQLVLHATPDEVRVLVAPVVATALALDAKDRLLVAAREGVFRLVEGLLCAVWTPPTVEKIRGLAVGPGDALYVAAAARVLRVGSGQVEVIAQLDGPVRALTATRDGRLFAADDGDLNTRRPRQLNMGRPRR